MIRLYMALAFTLILYLGYAYVFTQPYMDSLHHKIDSMLGIHSDEHK